MILKSAFIEEKFSQYLCFTVTIGSNNLIPEQEYTEQQHHNYELIKSLHDGGMGYRKIAQYLNEQGIKTVRGNTWKNTQVFSVLKRYHERLTRIKDVRKYDHGME
ncbi:MAG: recombinase family protein, partial [Pseudomonadota bacterium]|nr:recombinase family protein [Pseudomonadota bacterium]